MRRPTIADIVKESGISRATVDRVLNRRPGVHPETVAQVQRAVARLKTSEEPAGHRPAIDFALKLDIGMMTQLRASAGCLGERRHEFHDLHQKNEQGILSVIRMLCEDHARPLVVTVTNTPAVVQELARARRNGKIVVALVSDLPPEAKDAFVGIDNRGAGETAALLVGRALGAHPTAVGLVLGDHAYRCHEEREMGFRTLLRSRFPRIVLVGEAVGEDSPIITRTAVLKLLTDHPGLGALYNVSGGNQGMADAIAEAGRTEDILTIGHEINHVSLPLLRTGRMAYLLSQDPRDLLREAVRQIDTARAERSGSNMHVDFGVYTAANVPSYGRFATL